MKTWVYLLLSTLFIQTIPVLAMEEDDRPGPSGQRREVPTRENQFELIGDVLSSRGNSQARFRITYVGNNRSIEEILQLLTVQQIEFEAQLRADLHLDPDITLPQDLGYARERVQCEFEYAGRQQSCEGIFPTLYSLQGVRQHSVFYFGSENPQNSDAQYLWSVEACYRTKISYIIT